VTKRARMVLGLLVLGACSDAAGTPREGTSDAATIANALTHNLAFEDGEVRDGELPGSDDDSVLLLPLVDTVLMSPGGASLMPLNLFNPHGGDDPVVATLMQFGKAPEHVRVPVPQESATEGDVDNPGQVSEKVCEGLCARTYLVKVVEALELASGKVGKHAERTVLLDCRDDAMALDCDGDDQATPDASVNEALDASLPVAARVTMGLLDTVKAICACAAAQRPTALICAGVLAQANSACHTAALQDYAAASRADLQCAIDGADSAPSCLAACDQTTAAACLTELMACGVDLSEVERALLSCETFACADGGSRVDGSKLCDGTADCGDGTDESSPTCDAVNPQDAVP
jgi:hypothetical protein